MTSLNGSSSDDSDGDHLLAIEVEEYFQAAYYEDLLLPAEWDSLPGRVETCVGDLLRVLERHDTSATFFMSQWVTERHPELVARIADRGHEIGLLWTGGGEGGPVEEEKFRRQVASVKALLEGLAHLSVRGFRSSRCCLPYEAEWVYDVLISQGFAYDASVCAAGSTGRSGEGARWLHTVDRRSGEILEIPRPALRVLGRHVRTASGRRLRQLPYRLTASTLATYTERGRPAVVSIRSWEIDHYHPRITGASWSRFLHRVGIRRTLPLLERLLCEFDFSSGEEVLPITSEPESDAGRRPLRARAAEEGRT